jgi:predicted N-acetyltransferase YhbS
MVHPDYQGQGIGTELINRMISLLKQNHIYMISVIFDENLKEFYNKFGFQFTCAGQMQTFGCE